MRISASSRTSASTFFNSSSVIQLSRPAKKSPRHGARGRGKLPFGSGQQPPWTPDPQRSNERFGSDETENMLEELFNYVQVPNYLPEYPHQSRKAGRHFLGLEFARKPFVSVAKEFA